MHVAAMAGALNGRSHLSILDASDATARGEQWSKVEHRTLAYLTYICVTRQARAGADAPASELILERAAITEMLL